MLLLILASAKNSTLQRSPKSTNLISPVNASEEVGDNGRYVKKYKTSTIHLIVILNKTMAFKNLTVKYLHKEIEWEPRQQNVRKELHDVENSEHHPINKPLCVVLFVCTFHSFNPKKRHSGVKQICLGMKYRTTTRIQALVNAERMGQPGVLLFRFKQA